MMMFNRNRKNKPRFGINLMMMYLLITAVLIGFYFSMDNTLSKKVSWTEFTSTLEAGGLTKIEVANSKDATGYLTPQMAEKVFNKNELKSGSKPVITTQIPSTDKLDNKIEEVRKQGKFRGNVEFKDDSNFWSIVMSFGPFVLIMLFWLYMMRGMGNAGGGGGGVFSVGKSKATMYDADSKERVTFKDVAGLEESKVEITEIVDFLRNPKHYTELGGKIPKGALLVGPPGTGKTLLAKAVAGEANVPFFSMSGSDFVEMFVGVGASRVRDLFKQAKEKAPCIVFIDEIDAVGRARGRNANMGGNDERENTLNQLLTEMDGFGSNSGVIILAATNRADILDKALMRSGRFDRQIYVDLPELNDRKEIFAVHLRNVKIDGSVDIEMLARQTPGFSGADIANVCNEAALIAARRKKKAVQRQDFNDAVDRIVGGLEKRSKIMTEDERRSIAIHEAGHATVSWHLRYGDPLIKVTIVPRGKALGAAWYLPEERQIEPKEALLDEICSLMAGRAAEEIFLGILDTGAINDMERATKIATAMVTYYGMSSRLPNISYYDSTGEAYGFSKPYSEERARTIDDEVQAIINEQYERAKTILQEHANGHHRLADLLLEREVIYTEDAEEIFGKRAWPSRTDEILKLNQQKQQDQTSITSATEPVDDQRFEPQVTAHNLPDPEPDTSDEETEETPPPFTK